MDNIVAELPAELRDDFLSDDVRGDDAAAPDDGSPAPATDDGGDLAARAQVVEFAVRAAPDPAADAVPETAAEFTAERTTAERTTAERTTAERTTPERPGRRRARSGPNKREVARQQTREAIVDAAAELFAERGFDQVSVLEIAQRAGVVEKTVFNHFPVKEGLVFQADPPIRAALLEAVHRRPAGESVAAAAGSFIVAAISQLGSPAAAGGVAEMARVIRGSRTLQTREREILGALTAALAEQITVETRAPLENLEPWLAANAVLGLYTGLLELARDRVLSGESGPELVAQLRARGQRGLALLQFGLAGYAKRR